MNAPHEINAVLGMTAETIAEKLAYNATRADHRPENRKTEGGKAY